MTGFTFQSLKPQDCLSNELRSVIRDNVLQFYAKGLSTEAEEEVLTALYERLSHGRAKASPASIWKRRWSAGAQDAPPWPLLLI